PKMCTFACPVTSATGRDDAVPWSFHRTVSDLATGRLPLVAEAADRLTACSGCLACQVPCVFDQDVPAQVRAGRAALVDAGVADPVVAAAIAHVADGRNPAGSPLPVAPPGDDDLTTLIVAGCRDDGASLDAVVAVLRAAGERVAVHVPEGCCGALLDDLGARDAAASARRRLAVEVADHTVDTLDAAADPDDAVTIVATDPHCLGSLRSAGLTVTDVASHLDAAVTDGRLRFTGSSWAATWHDPCVLARGEGVTAAPRRVLTAAGAELIEPEHHGERTGCSGAGLGMDQLDPAAAGATAALRVRELGTGPVVTGCARAAERLRAAGADVADLPSVLVTRLAGSPEHPPGTPAAGSAGTSEGSSS
ncbi:MAG: (Fe-S)-binding protein, partial [Nitriliruptor sp.]|uniref:heterodisulfide reductase-related iron-sulfur binding cluster n=1 Tax=Nitriliruptor sp. TaxID=2448056 RepID=UPI00349FE301